MKNKFIILICTLSVWANAAQINYLTQDFYGFEDGGTAYWIQNNEWAVTNEKAADGTTYSMKFTSLSPVDAQKKAHGGSNGSGINLKPGNYTLKVKVWVAKDAAITSFNFTIKQPKWINLPMQIDTVTKEQWVELSQDFTVDQEIINSGSLLTMTSAYGGKGTFYVDEIQIWGDGDIPIEPEMLPFNSSIESVNEGNISLPEGLYDVSLMVFVPDTTTISSFHTQIQAPWTTLKWRIDTLPKGQWVELHQSMQLSEDAQASTFKIIVSNHPDFGGGKGTFYIDDIKFNWDHGVAVDEHEVMIDFSVYPNPASERIVLEYGQKGNYRVYNTRGQLVKSGLYPGTQSSIDVSDLEAGTYLLQLISKQGTKVKPVLIK